jgi:hypothetical protein
MDQATKDVVSIIESSVNVALHLMTASEPAFPGSVFRARYVTAAHAVSSLRRLVEATPITTPSTDALVAALDHPACRLVTEPEMRSGA